MASGIGTGDVAEIAVHLYSMVFSCRGNYMDIELSSKARLFADLFFGGSDDCRGNTARCYKHLYPRCKDSTAETNGPRLLRKAQVQQYLESKA